MGSSSNPISENLPFAKNCVSLHRNLRFRKMKRSLLHYSALPLLWLFLLMIPSRIVVAQGIDYNILCELQQHRTDAMDNLMEWTSNSLVLAPAIPAGMLGAGLLTDDKNMIHLGTATGFSFLTATVITEVTKNTVRRPRPYNGYPDDLLPVKTTYGFSFPSGHTSLTFSVATALSLSYPKWYVVVPSMLWASGVAFSRLYLGVHYPSDVLTGVLVGVASGFCGYWLSSYLQKDSPVPTTKAIMIPITINF